MTSRVVGGASTAASTTIEAIDVSGFADVRAHWDFEADLEDSSGNAYHLANTAANQFVTIAGKTALASNAGTRLDEVAGVGNSPNLQITGALTVHVLVYLNDGLHSSSAYLAAFLGTGETEAANILYALQIATDSTLEYIHEYGSGSNANAYPELSGITGKWSLLTMTRDAAGRVLVLYIDGEAVWTDTAASAPTGGTTGEFVSEDVQGYLGQIVIDADEQSASEVLAVAQQVGVA